MALTSALNVRESENIMGKYRANIVDFTLDSSYPKNATNGYPIPVADFGFKSIYMILPVPAGVAAGPYSFVYDTTNLTLRVFVTSTGSEVANGVSLATVVIRALVLGF